MRQINYLISGILLVAVIAGCSSGRKLTQPRPARDDFRLKARDYFLEGIFYEQQSRYNEALVRYYQALHHDSTSATIYNSIAENHLRLGHLESAEILLRKALSLDPKNTESLNLMAECQYRLGNDDQAIAYYLKLLRINPYDEAARQYLMLLYQKNGDELGIARQNEELLKLYGGDPLLMERLASTYLKYKKYDQALHYLREVLKSDSTRAETYYLIGYVMEMRQQPDSAVIYYQKSLQHNAGFAQALDRITLLYRSQRRWQKIIDVYRPVLAADSSDRAARILSAEAYYYLEKYDQARRLLKPVMALEEPPLSVLELAGRVEMEAKNFTQAVALFRRILAKDEKNKYAWLFLAFTQSDMNQPDSAEVSFRRALELYPDDAMIWSFYGMNLQKQEKYRQAIRAFQKALQLEPDNTNALTNLPLVYENLKMFSQCDSIYEIALKRLPDNPLILNNYSYSLAERNTRLQEALQMAQKAISLKADEAAYLDTVGWIYFKLGNLPQAEKYIKKSIELRQTSPVVEEHLGDVYYQMKRYDKAREYWQKALEGDPGKQTLLDKLNKIR